MFHTHEEYPDYLFTEDGRTFSLHQNRFLLTRINANGYETISLNNKDGDQKWLRVHRLVAQIFIPNPENKPEVNHKDTNKLNNHKDNLEWVTSKENKEHAISNGLYESMRENSPNVILTKEQVHAICRLIQDGRRNKDIAEMFGVHKDTISSIKIKRLWTDISSQYSFTVKRQERKSEKTVRSICEMLANNHTSEEVASTLSIDVREIRRIKRREIFSSISCEYKF